MEVRVWRKQPGEGRVERQETGCWPTKHPKGREREVLGRCSLNHEWARMATNSEREEGAFLGGGEGLAGTAGGGNGGALGDGVLAH